MTAVAVGLTVLLFYGFFYRGVVARWGSIVRWMLRPLRLDSAYPVRHVEAVGKLTAAAVAQLLFAVALIFAFDVRPDDFLGTHPALLPAAAVLGIGELALTSLLCTVVVEFVTVTRGSARGTARRDWSTQSRAGWMSYFLLTVRTAPPAVALACIGLYVGVEELVFRGVLIPTFLHAETGGTFAVAASTTLFVAVQALAMPSRRAALFPMVGAAVIGVVHGILFLYVPDVIPLAVAHITYFTAAMLHARPRAVAGRTG